MKISISCNAKMEGDPDITAEIDRELALIDDAQLYEGLEDTEDAAVEPVS